MKDSDAECSMCVVLVRFGLMMGSFGAVRVQMDMPVAIVLVFVGVNSKSLSQCPYTDTQQHHTHETFAPRRETLERQQIA